MQPLNTLLCFSLTSIINSTATMFLETLPPELRVQIYNIIIERTIKSKTESPHQYRGLILSCKQVHAEYMFEANKTPNPIQEIIESHWSLPESFVLQPSNYNCPMQLHISIPETVPSLPDKERKAEIYAIIPPLLARTHCMRAIFSVYDSEQTIPRTGSTRLEMNQSSVGHLYDLICWAIQKHRGKECRAPLAPRRTLEPCHPVNVCENVALHMQNRVVVYDAHMSEEELRGASSGRLWDEGN